MRMVVDGRGTWRDTDNPAPAIRAVDQSVGSTQQLQVLVPEAVCTAGAAAYDESCSRDALSIHTQSGVNGDNNNNNDKTTRRSSQTHTTLPAVSGESRGRAQQQRRPEAEDDAVEQAQLCRRAHLLRQAL
jgi:hypothetical protein